MRGEIFYCGGHNIEKKYVTAEAYLKPVTKQADDNKARIAAMLLRGMVFYEGGGLQRSPNYVKACRLLEEAAVHSGDDLAKASANMTLAQIYFYGGHGVRKDYSKAVAHLLIVSQQNANAYAQWQAKLWLGRAFYYGYGATENYETARAYFEAVAQPEVDQFLRADACVMLGAMYYYGYGVEVNYAKAHEYLDLAAWQKEHNGSHINSSAQGDAYLLLGEIYFYGNYGVKQNSLLAKFYLTQAAKLKGNRRISTRVNQLLGCLSDDLADNFKAWTDMAKSEFISSGPGLLQV